MGAKQQNPAMVLCRNEKKKLSSECRERKKGPSQRLSEESAPIVQTRCTCSREKTVWLEHCNFGAKMPKVRQGSDPTAYV
jgi:hypothetical protein